MDKEFVFITGPSESGKSGAAEYMENKFDTVKHLKMRDIIKVANSTVKDNKVQFWREYIKVAVSMSDGKNIIVMDTLRKPESAILLNEILGRHMFILYIEATFKQRVLREYTKLKYEGKNISLEEVIERTKKKDEEKERSGLYQIRNLMQQEDGKIHVSKEGILFPVIINNDGNIEDLYKRLDQFVQEVEENNRDQIER